VLNGTTAELYLYLTEFWWGNLRKRENWEDLRVWGKDNIKMNVKNGL
jgi:hypothetical protein